MDAGKYLAIQRFRVKLKRKKKADKNTELKAILMDSYGVKQITFL